MFKPANRIAVILAATLSGALSTVRADTPPAAMFPFVIPWDDASEGAATDVSFLNAKPAGVNGAIVVKDGHFVESKTGKRIKFLGTNFTFEANYPSHADADKIAAHIAKLGINIVRIHHHDQNNRPLWDHTAPGTTKMSPDGLDRLDYLISALKKNGVFVNLNPHVSRQYAPADGFPASVAHMPEPYDKRIDNIDHHMIDLQKQFAKDYLTRVNPYTGLNYCSDPCVAVVEINNENSLVGWAVSDHNKFFEALPEPFRSDVVTKWNVWLTAKYGNHANLVKAWTPVAKATATSDVLSSATVWNFEDHTGSGTMAKESEGDSTTADDVTLTTTAKPEQAWQAQAGLAHLNITEGALYAVTFRAKADKARDISVYTGIDQPDWHHIGLGGTAPLGTDWKPFRFVFQASQTVAHENRLMFVVGNDTGTVEIADARISPVTADNFMPEGQSLDNKTIDIPTDAGSPASNDFVHFLSDSETAYADEMRAYLRNDLKVKANIIDTQMSYGNVASFRREAGSDFADGHAYWQHPSFPGRPWDGDNWYIKNTPQVDALASGEGGELAKLAQYRWHGRPYSVSEYNHPFPSDFQSEMFPELATFAAAQDWDMIYGFDYGRYGADAKNDQIQGFFDTGTDPAKAAFMPAAALIFRTDAFGRRRNETILRVPASELAGGKPASDEWQAAGVAKPDILSDRVSVAVDPALSKPAVKTVKIKGPDIPNVAIVKSASGAQYVASDHGATAVSGYVGGTTVAGNGIVAAFPPFGNNFASLTLTPTDGKDVAASHRMLFTITGKAENLDMVWNATHTSYSRKIGHGPVQAEGIPASITITNPFIKHAWALDSTGARIATVPVTVANGKATIAVGPDYKTVWYELGA